MTNAITAALLFLFAANAHAIPLPKPGQRPASGPTQFTQNYNFDGIVALNNCSGSIVRLEKSQDTDLALIFTNGHCNETGLLDTGKHLIHLPSQRKFNFMKPDATTAGQASATEIVYATMTNTDLAIYKLAMTYADVKAKFNVNPLTLSSAHPSAGTPIEIISGYWRRGFQCQAEAFIPQVKEDKWLWMDSIRYSRPGCEIIGGTSGSPVINAGTRTMIGINNTGNEDGERCTFNNPCEVDEKGAVTYEQGRGYAQQTYQVYTCLNEKGEIDVNVPGCQLPH